MIRIRLAKDFIDKLEYSNYEDYETYPNSVFSCDNCGDKVGFAYNDLHKHRFSKDSNLKRTDKILMDRLILSLIPKYKLKQNIQIWSLNNHDRLKVLIQRLYLRIIGIKGKFPSIPTTKDNIPDSFIDYYCPKCNRPIRIYYFSYIGGKHCEMGFVIQYIMN
jgi:hypothetical protein